MGCEKFLLCRELSLSLLLDDEIGSPVLSLVGPYDDLTREVVDLSGKEFLLGGKLSFSLLFDGEIGSPVFGLSGFLENLGREVVNLADEEFFFSGVGSFEAFSLFEVEFLLDGEFEVLFSFDFLGLESVVFGFDFFSLLFPFDLLFFGEGFGGDLSLVLDLNFFVDELFLELLFFDFFLEDLLVVGLFKGLDIGVIEILFDGSLSFSVFKFLSEEFLFSAFISEDVVSFLDGHAELMVVDSFDLSLFSFGVGD